MVQEANSGHGGSSFQTPLPSSTEEKRLGKLPLGSCSNNLSIGRPPLAHKRERDGTMKCYQARDDIKDGKENKSSACNNGNFSNQEVHVLNERERRKRMRDMFHHLHSLLPKVLGNKMDKSTIVGEAVKYIRSLQQTLHGLERRKLKRGSRGFTTPPPLPSAMEEEMRAPINGSSSTAPPVLVPPGGGRMVTWTSPRVVVSVCDREGHVTVCAPRIPSLLTLVVQLLEKHSLEVVTAQVSSDRNSCVYMIHARATGLSDHLVGTQMTVEETFKLVAGEILFWLSS